MRAEKSTSANPWKFESCTMISFVEPSGLRVTAVEALRVAATPAAVGTLEGLTEDGDKQVRAAAQAAVGDLKRN